MAFIGDYGYKIQQKERSFKVIYLEDYRSWSLFYSNKQCHLPIARTNSRAFANFRGECSAVRDNTSARDEEVAGTVHSRKATGWLFAELRGNSM